MCSAGCCNKIKIKTDFGKMFFTPSQASPHTLDCHHSNFDRAKTDEIDYLSDQNRNSICERVRERAHTHKFAILEKALPFKQIQINFRCRKINPRVQFFFVSLPSIFMVMC
jgi:hypothetical protein